MTINYIICDGIISHIMIIEKLTKLGLSKAESLVYLSCLENGELSVVEIAQITGIARTTLYTPINALLKNKLLSQIVRKKRKLLRSAPARMLEDLVDQQIKISSQRKTIVGPLIASLQKKIKNTTDGSVEIIDGEKGIEYLISHILSKKEDFYWIGSFDTILLAIKEESLFRLFTWKRLAGKTTSYAISDNSLIKHPKFAENIQTFRMIKILEDKISLPGVIIAFSGIISLINFSNRGKVKIYLIHDIQCSEFYKFIFLELWKKL